MDVTEVVVRRRVYAQYRILVPAGKTAKGKQRMQCTNCEHTRARKRWDKQDFKRCSKCGATSQWLYWRSRIEALVAAEQEAAEARGCDLNIVITIT